MSSTYNKSTFCILKLHSFFSDYYKGAETPDLLLSTLINIELRTAINLQMGESISSSFSFPESIFLGYF